MDQHFDLDRDVIALYFTVSIVAWTLTMAWLSENRTRRSLLLTLTVHTPSSNDTQYIWGALCM